jgi:fucose permease
MNGMLLAHLGSVLDLSYLQATLIEGVVHRITFASIPSAKLIERIGPRYRWLSGNPSWLRVRSE